MNFSLSMDVTLELGTSIGRGSEPGVLSTEDLPDRWSLGPSRLGTLAPSSGEGLSWSVVGSEAHTTLETSYTAGDQEGVEQLPLHLWNSSSGRWDGESEHPSCTTFETVVPVFVGGDWKLVMGREYSGSGSTGEAVWAGTFEILGDSVQGRGVYRQVDRGTCFRAESSQDFRVTGVVEYTPDGPYVTLEFPYVGQKRGGDPDMRPTAECMFRGLAEVGTLLLDVAGEMKGGLEKVRLPIRWGQADSVFNGVYVWIGRM